jgi:Tfp pilus assembly protein PilN
LFKAVESSASDRVALLSIQPDEKRGTVSIGGEARNVEAMLDYVRRLQRSGTLSNIYLVNHQVEQRDPQTPVRFSVVATWLNK